MNRTTERRIVALAATALALALTANPGLAVPRHKSVSVQAGTTARVSNHTYFKSSTCQARAIPKVVIRRKPTKGSLVAKEGELPLRHARTEKGQKCIGKPMRTAIVQYTAGPKSTGEDTLAYDVIFPASCKHCTTYEVTVTVSITADAPPPTTTAAPDDDTNE
jgi:hypothetical protein